MSRVLVPRPARLPLAAGAALILLAAVIAWLPATAAAVVVAGLILGLGVLFRPRLALYFLIFAIPFGSLVPLPVAGANVTAADILLALALVLWLARQIVRRRIFVRPVFLALPFAVFIFAAGLSGTGALSLQAFVKELAKWLEMLAVYWLLAQGEPDDGGDVRRLVAVILLAGLAQALVGMYQSFFGVGPEGFIFMGGGLRAFGTFDQPNPYAGYLGLIIPLAFGTALGIVLSGEWRHHLSNLALLTLAAGALAAMLVALVLSLSRGAWLGVAAALGVTFLIRSRRAALFGAALGVFLAALILLGQLNLIPDVISSRFAGVSDYFGLQDVRGVKVTDANYAIVERMAHWQAGIDMFAAHPWLGVGFGNYAAVYPAYSLPHWDDPLGHAHNYYINLLAETGFVGLAAYLVLWAAVFWLAWQAVRRARGTAQGIAAGAFGVLVALSVHNLFDDLFVHSMQIQVGITLGMIEALAGQARS